MTYTLVVSGCIKGHFFAKYPERKKYKHLDTCQTDKFRFQVGFKFKKLGNGCPQSRFQFKAYTIISKSTY